MRLHITTHLTKNNEWVSGRERHMIRRINNPCSKYTIQTGITSQRKLHPIVAHSTMTQITKSTNNYKP